MFDDIFPENYEETHNTNYDHTKNNPSSINCASYLEKPELPRGDSKFVGLLNQGGTCYMNSALQVLFMNPLFRQIIYDLPLCENDNVKSSSSFIPQGQMYEILIALQKLFIKLEKYDIRALSTKSLTEAFEWSGSDGSVQHDSQEFIRLLFETLDNILHSTDFNGIINNLFRVVNYSYRTCSNCNHTNTSEEYNLEITLPVRDIKNLQDSLNSLYKSNEIINDYKCDECSQRVDLLKGSKICQLPILLNFSLMKMDYDYNTFERIKLNSRFEFPLEIDMREYMKHGNPAIEEEYKYELYGIIIHRGTPYQGHYFSYIRDLNNDGHWDLLNLNEFKNQPEKIETQEEEKSLNNGKSKTDQKDISKKKKNKKNSTQEEKEYEKLNFDACDHPIEYINKDLSKNWFDFNDTSITPIRVGRIQKQFQSSESAYVLFYIKKNVSINKVIAPQYLENYVEELNQKICEQRILYEEELKSLTITIYNSTNFYIDEFGILSIKYNQDLEKTNNQIEMKLKFYDTFEKLLTETIIQFQNQDSEFKNIGDMILYEIMYKKDTNLQNNKVIILQKYDLTMKSQTLENLKICHKGRFLLFNKNSKVTGDEDNLLTNLIDLQIGINYEPINLKIFVGTDEKYIRVFSNLDVLSLKEKIKQFLSLPQLTDITLNFKSGSGTNSNLISSQKNINLDKVGYDRKNQCWLTLKQLKILDNSLIFITKSNDGGLCKKNNFECSSNLEFEEKINCLVKIEDEEEITVIKAKLNISFEQLILKIKKKLNLNYDEQNKSDTERDKDHISPLIRVRKEMDGKIIFKNHLTNKLHTDEMFIEGGVRLRVEFGEPYEVSEILLKIIIDNKDNKDNKDSGSNIREFIGDPEKTTISDLKKFICEQFNLKIEEHMFYKTSALGDPIKAIKNENQTLTKSGLKDSDIIYLKNISADIYETYLIKLFSPRVGVNLQEDNEFVFKPIEENKNLILELNLTKEISLKNLKEKIIEDLGLKMGQITTEFLRLRSISKKYDPERIFKGESNTIKKLNFDNPQMILYEILNEPENLKENQIQLYLWKRNLEGKSYYDKKSIIFEFSNNLASSDQLYEIVRHQTGWKNIKLAKYAKFNYQWDEINEINENGPINLRKLFNLRDGDWIGVRNEEHELSKKDDFQTEEDKKVNKKVILKILGS